MKIKKKQNKPNVFILDVDGVMTNGDFFYSSDGKVMKVFGPDDNDALSLVKRFMKIHFVTGDKKGFDITHKRIVKDMKFPLTLVSTIRRIDWIKKKYDPKKVIYMGDGIFDHYVMKSVNYSIAPANANELALKNAKFICKRSGGDRAVAEACLHILNKFFKKFDSKSLPPAKIKLSGNWSV